MNETNLSIVPANIQFKMFMQFVKHRFYRSNIDFSNWDYRTDSNNYPLISHNGDEVVNSGSIKTKYQLWEWVNELHGSVFFG